MNILILSLPILFSTHTITPYDLPNTEEILKSAREEIVEEAPTKDYRNSYIIIVDPSADLDSVINEVQSVTGGEVTHEYRDSIHGFAIEVPTEYTEDDLYLHEAIESVEPDIVIRPLDYDEDGDYNTSSQASSSNYDPSTHLRQFLPSSVNRMEGDLSPTAKIDGGDDPMPVNIAIIDTGVDERHPELNVVFSKNFISSSKSATDDNGHGTHVAGIAAAKDNAIGIVGVAPGAHIYNLKVLNKDAWGYLSDIVQAVDWVTKQSKPTSSDSSNSDYDDLMKKYDKAMSRYEKYMSKGDRYVERVQGYLAEAEEYKAIAYQYLNGTPGPDDKYVQRAEKYRLRAEEYRRIAYQYLNGTPGPDDKYIQRAEKYRLRAEEYRSIAYEYLNQGNTDRYERYLEKYEKYMAKSADYIERSKQNYQKNYEKYWEKYEKDMAKSVRYLEKSQENLQKNYEKYWKKYEKSLSKAEKYQSRIQSYVDRANEYLAEANEYKRLADQLIAPVEQTARNPNKIDVVNISIGAVGKSSALHKAIQASVRQGVVYVVSAGNARDDLFGPDRQYGTSDDNIPAAYPEVVTVSASIETDGRAGGFGPNDPWGAKDDTMAAFSNFSITTPPNNPVQSPGRGIDVVAPGVNIFSTWPGGGYHRLTGTSMSAPHVAGAFALLIVKLGQDANNDGIHNEEDVAILRQIVIDTAQPQSQWRTGNTMDPDNFHEWLVQVASF